MINPDAQIIDGVSTVTVDDENLIRDKRVLIIEDGPTVTHGGMPYGAGTVAAKRIGVKEIVDPRPFSVGSITKTFNKYTHLTKILPAMGYGRKQIKELEQTINNTDCDIVISGTPIDITRVLKPDKPIIRVKYKVGDETAKELEKIIKNFIDKN